MKTWLAIAVSNFFGLVAILSLPILNTYDLPYTGFQLIFAGYDGERYLRFVTIAQLLSLGLLATSIFSFRRALSLEKESKAGDKSN